MGWLTGGRGSLGEEGLELDFSLSSLCVYVLDFICSPPWCQADSEAQRKFAQ